MKIFAAVALALFLGAYAQAAQSNAAPTLDSAAAPAAQSKIDPAKGADIRHLLDVAGTGAIVQQTRI
ncbi:MAG: hypothetical protein ACREBW_02570 [Candidatus Micrarchaeaceae archaeon]